MIENTAAPPKLHRKVAFITLLSVAASMGIAVAMTAAFGSALTFPVLAIAVLCPAIIAPPVSAIFLLQSDRLERANTQLKTAQGQLKEAREALERHSRLGRMTGLINRETFLDTLAPGNRRSDHGFLFVVDSDHITQINDTHGHQTGDRALREIAAAIASCIREGDMAARIGGEEFAIFLPGASLAEAITVSERVRQAIENLDFRDDFGDRIALTVSIGGAEFVQNGMVDAVLGKAGRMLHEAKRTGRNRAMVVPELSRVA